MRSLFFIYLPLGCLVGLIEGFYNSYKPLDTRTNDEKFFYNTPEVNKAIDRSIARRKFLRSCLSNAACFLLAVLWYLTY